MKHKTLRGLQLVLGLLLFAAGSPRPGGLELLVQQIEVMGARQWLGLIAESASAPVSQRIPAPLPGRFLASVGRDSSADADTA